ncbi:MAG: nitrite reductase [Aeromicrobium sp.]|uniref:nitrite reductase n=1 Tax=Aeromicrobium sp. TaxID=1871063 RepID=UPI0039E342E1
MTVIRDRQDRCPGALRPWPAGDGMLVRLRLIGGRVQVSRLRRLIEVAERFGDGRVHVTSRANLQVRGFPGRDGLLDEAALSALEHTGLLPTRTHELVRNVMLSPQSGLAGGKADLRDVADELDRLLCADPALGTLPGRFLFVLDDGRGDVAHRSCDLGLVALDEQIGQLRIGEGWGETVPLGAAAGRLADLASAFLRARGAGDSAAWHVNELAEPLAEPLDADPRIPPRAEPLPFGEVPGGRHVATPEAGIDRDVVASLAAGSNELIITPWRGVLIPKAGSHA